MTRRPACLAHPVNCFEQVRVDETYKLKARIDELIVKCNHLERENDLVCRVHAAVHGDLLDQCILMHTLRLALVVLCTYQSICTQPRRCPTFCGEHLFFMTVCSCSLAALKILWYIRRPSECWKG